MVTVTIRVRQIKRQRHRFAAIETLNALVGLFAGDCAVDKTLYTPYKDHGARIRIIGTISLKGTN